MEKSNVLVTGATGFVGRFLVKRLIEHNYAVKTVVRKISAALFNKPCDFIEIPDLCAAVNWLPHLEKVDAVIHLAGRAHILKETESNAAALFHEVNTTATLKLAEQAAAAGVKRFIYVSTIKVNGSITTEQAFTEEDISFAADAYGQSKLEAEKKLLEMMKNQSGMEIVIVRPPLVYGPHAVGNFLSLLKWVQRDIPLPLAKLKNKRSLISIFNLAEFLELCIHHPNAANQIFVVADGEDLSTPALISKLAAAMNKKSKLLPVPLWVLNMGAQMTGKKEWYEKLCASLQVDASKAFKLLNWKPSTSVDAGLKMTVDWFMGRS
jgi:nucleoside-diphosphate-sugar epimerase